MCIVNTKKLSGWQILIAKEKDYTSKEFSRFSTLFWKEINPLQIMASLDIVFLAKILRDSCNFIAKENVNNQEKTSISII